MTRRQAREQAFVLVFEKSFDHSIEMQDIIDLAVEEQLQEPNEFSTYLALKTWENVDSIDSYIDNNSVGWKKSRLSKVTLAILRIAICEIVYCEDIPVGVSINEAVDICRKYANDEEAAFVNGVLGSVSKSLENKAE
ncbi:MAG TPA: transcription antitermination factor NusB [Clostridia bacterium]|nr:transcription antitermination factor NusB [Clostridia bacterium]